MDDFYQTILTSLTTFLVGAILSLLAARVSRIIFSRITARTKSETDDYIASLLIEIIKPLGFILSFIIGWKFLLIGGIVDKTFIGISKFICLIYIVNFINRVFIKIIQITN